MSPGAFPSWGARRCRRSRLAGGPQRERAAGRQERLDAGVGEAHARDAGAGGADDRAGEHFEGGGGSGGGVVADAFGVQEAPAGRVAALRHGGEVRQLFADAEVAGLVVGGLGAQRPSLRYCPSWVFL